MELEAAYPVVVTDRLAECRAFYTQRLGFQVVFEATWFVYLRPSDQSADGIAFMSPDHPSKPPGPEAFDGKGILLTLQVTDAASEFERLRQTGVSIDHTLRNEPWGQRRFGLYDPAGVWVDVVEQIEPEPGFWDRYLPKE
jgi:catechol 2,3-dioxygenase-like lactoylglutathione lyase family enzyme